MTSFKEFIDEKVAQRTPMIAYAGAVDGSSREPSYLGQMQRTARESIMVSISSNKEAQDIAPALAELVTSPDFIGELSDKIGLPTPAETEDQFVARAKSVMRDLLSKRLAK